MSPERARSRNTMEKTEYVSRDGIEPRTVGKRSLDVWNEREQRLVGRVEWRRCTKELGVDLQQQPRLLICCAPHHDTVQALQLSECLLNASKPTVEHDFKIRVCGLQTTDQPVIKRRHLAVLARR